MKITEAVPREGYKLFLRFEDGVAGEVDLSALAGRGVFAAWRQPGVFERVTVTEAGAVEWPGEVDLCPDALYMQLDAYAARHGGTLSGLLANAALEYVAGHAER